MRSILLFFVILGTLFIVLAFPAKAVHALACPLVNGPTPHPDNPYPNNGVLSDGVTSGITSAPVGSTLSWIVNLASGETDANGIATSFVDVTTGYSVIATCDFSGITLPATRSCSYTFNQPGSYAVTHHLRYPTSLRVCSVYNLGPQTYCARSPCADPAVRPPAPDPNYCGYVAGCGYLAQLHYSVPADGAYFTIFAPTTTPTPTVTPTHTPTYTPTRTPTIPPTIPPTLPPTITPTRTLTPTNTPVPPTLPPSTITPTRTPTSTLTSIPTIPPSITPTRTHTPTLTNTPTLTITPPVPPSIIITGVFIQQTGDDGGIYLRDAPGLLSGKGLPVVEPVVIQGLQSSSGVPDDSCAHTSCHNLPTTPIAPNIYNWYECGIELPDACSLRIPQQFTVYGISALSDWYRDGTSVVTLDEPLSNLYYSDPIFQYRDEVGWIKLINTDFIRPRVETGAALANHIPFITDRYYANPFGTSVAIYSDTESADPGHSTMVDYMPGQEVGGMAAGSIDTFPTNDDSQFGGSVDGYSLDEASANSKERLEEYATSLLAAKPYSPLVGDHWTLNPGVIYKYVTDASGSVTVNAVNITASLVGGVLVDPGAVVVVTDTDGNLADVVFTTDVNASDADLYSFVVIAKNITLSSTVTGAHALFIASGKFGTGSSGIPLKIVGNIVATEGILQGRTRLDLDHARPSVLMVFDPQIYTNTLRLLSIRDLEYAVIE